MTQQECDEILGAVWERCRTCRHLAGVGFRGNAPLRCGYFGDNITLVFYNQGLLGTVSRHFVGQSRFGEIAASPPSIAAEAAAQVAADPDCPAYRRASQ